ncbi:7661_t:CDS:1, partial [Racocetra persica]
KKTKMRKITLIGSSEILNDNLPNEHLKKIFLYYSSLRYIVFENFIKLEELIIADCYDFDIKTVS